jgi:hypothetical protein
MLQVLDFDPDILQKIFSQSGVASPRHQEPQQRLPVLCKNGQKAAAFLIQRECPVQF